MGLYLNHNAKFNKYQNICSELSFWLMNTKFLVCIARGCVFPNFVVIRQHPSDE